MKTGETVNGYKVVGVRNIIHGKFFSNTNIIAEFYVKAKRGNKYFQGYFTKDGHKTISLSYSHEAPVFIGDLVYFAETGTFANPLAIV